MAGVGFPVTVQRNSARWPCWTFSTEGVMLATGWAASPATEVDTPVKHSSKQTLPKMIKCDNADWFTGAVMEWNETLAGVYNHCLGILYKLCVMNWLDCDGLCPCPHHHPWQPISSEQTKQMRCGRQALAWPLGILLSAPVWLAPRLRSQSRMIPVWQSKRKASFSRQGGV